MNYLYSTEGLKYKISTRGIVEGFMSSSMAHKRKIAARLAEDMPDSIARDNLTLELFAIFRAATD